MPSPMSIFQEAVLSRRDNRQALRRLFQGYINDYGQFAGEQIIRAIIDTLGGMRISVPANGDHRGMRYQADSVMLLFECWREMDMRFGEASGKAIMQKFVMELKGLRISIPDHDDIFREERNRRIRAKYNGSNHAELAINWGISIVHVRNIIRGGE